jgi:hypothetical protein
MPEPRIISRTIITEEVFGPADEDVEDLDDEEDDDSDDTNDADDDAAE